ncbi:MAG: hypothetical protein R3F54_25695 [Alphaproteobacteria bacterium]
MRKLILLGILALAFTCAVSLTVPSQYSHSSPSSISDRLLQDDQNALGNPFG